jgi:hypothetical protein
MSPGALEDGPTLLPAKPLLIRLSYGNRSMFPDQQHLQLVAHTVDRHDSGAPRGERPDRNGRRDASLALASRRARKSTSGCPGRPKHPASLGAPLPLARPQARRKRGKELNDYGAAGAADRVRMSDVGDQRSLTSILCHLTSDIRKTARP